MDKAITISLGSYRYNVKDSEGFQQVVEGSLKIAGGYVIIGQNIFHRPVYVVKVSA